MAEETQEEKIVTIFQSDLDRLLKVEDELNTYKHVKQYQDGRIAALENWRHKVKDYIHSHGYTADFKTYIGMSADEVKRLMELVNENY